MESEVFEVPTGHLPEVVDITARVDAFCRDKGDGLVNVFVPHATCGVAIIETGAGSDDDLLTALDGLLPRDQRWIHRHGSPGHGADHVMPAIVAPSVSIPVLGGVVALGTWQSVTIVDLNRDNLVRTVRLSFLRE